MIAAEVGPASGGGDTPLVERSSVTPYRILFGLEREEGSYSVAPCSITSVTPGVPRQAGPPRVR